MKNVTITKIIHEMIKLLYSIIMLDDVSAFSLWWRVVSTSESREWRERSKVKLHCSLSLRWRLDTTRIDSYSRRRRQTFSPIITIVRGTADTFWAKENLTIKSLLSLMKLRYGCTNIAGLNKFCFVICFSKIILYLELKKTVLNI